MRSPFILAATLILGLLTAPFALADECQDCHSTSVFKVKHKLLYDYHVGYETSVHGLAGLSCVDCHGGDPKTKDEDLAHVGVRERVRDPQIPATCGRCHPVPYETFIGSDHHEVSADDRNALTCVVCHGSMEMDVTFVGRVHRKCMKCHDDSDDPASVDVLTNDIMSRISTIMGYLNIVRSSSPDAATLAEINQTFDRLIRQWHGLDLAGTESTSQELLVMLRTTVAAVR